MHIGFLLNHNNTHQVPHIVPFAFALSRVAPGVQVTVFSSSAEEENFARQIGLAYPGHRVGFERLHIPLWAKIADPLARSFVFLRKQVALTANLQRLAALDAVVTPEMTSLHLKSLPAFAKTKLIFTGHGAGDNRLGGSFDPRIGQFDLALMPGRKYAQGLLDVGYLAADRYGISGYPKLEAMARAGGQRRSFFKNDRPTVLYSPHHARALTSWHKAGADILDYFYSQREFNLIFAPHVLLFQRAWTKGARLPARFKSTGHVLIDTGSPLSVDMTYLKSADLFLGDVTSQFYEFLEQPRPAIFFDAHDTDWQDDPSYGHWHLGQVIRDVAKLPLALAQATQDFATKRAAQVAAFENTFAQATEPASVRGAEIIHAFLTTGTVPQAFLL